MDVRQLLVRLRILAIDQCHLADGLYQLALSDRAQFFHQGTTIFALGKTKLDLDKLMIVQGSLQFGLNAFGQPGLGYDQNRVPMVAARLVLFLLRPLRQNP